MKGNKKQLLNQLAEEKIVLFLNLIHFDRFKFMITSHDSEEIIFVCFATIGFTIQNISTSIRGAERCSSWWNSPFGRVCNALFYWNRKNQSKSIRGALFLQERSRSQWHRIWIWWRTLCKWVWVHNFFSIYIESLKAIFYGTQFHFTEIAKKLVGRKSKKMSCDNCLWKIKIIHQLKKVEAHVKVTL